MHRMFWQNGLSETAIFAALAVLAALATLSAAQDGGWVPGQVSATMCYWEQLRAMVMRDTLYLDGGALVWRAALADRDTTLVDDGNPLGMVYTLHLGTAFQTGAATNVSALFGRLDKVAAGTAAANRAPTYYDGALLGNDAEFFEYGGLLDATAAYTAPDADVLLAYRATAYGAAKPGFRVGFADVRLPLGVTRYVAYGGAARAPSEDKAWYFGGLRATGAEPIVTVGGGNASTMAVDVSDTLLTLDMTEQLSERWTNTTLPTGEGKSVRGRANPVLVWVPVGVQGLLVAVGGVVFPDFATVDVVSANETASAAESPAFLVTIDVYDVASGQWFQQPTTGAHGLTQRTRACAVVASATDGSSFNIYYYGGYDGLHAANADTYSDAVWVLSLPSFTWIRLSDGTLTHARAGHACVRPYPDQMLVVGGYPAKDVDSAAGACLADTPGGSNNLLQLYNLSSGRWLDHYSPDHWAPYTVPYAVLRVIGGNGHGGATATAPASGWATPALGRVFATPYPTSRLATFYPYTATSTPNTSHSRVPAFLAPLLGALGGLLLVTAVAVLVLLCRRCRGLHRQRDGQATAVSEVGTYDTSHDLVFARLRTQCVQQSAVATMTTPAQTPAVKTIHTFVSEMMADTALPVELPADVPVRRAADALHSSCHDLVSPESPVCGISYTIDRLTANAAAKAHP